MPAENNYTSDELKETARLLDLVSDFVSDDITIVSVALADADGRGLGLIDLDPDEGGWRYRAY